MADNRKLAQGLMMMTPAMRADLAGREQDIQRGKTVELLRKAGKEMYDNPIVNTAIGFSPVLGDMQAAGETMSALERGAPWQETAGYAVGMLPFIPMVGKTVWHGSPHTFDKFDLSKIGTGEGAQAYGHGLYLAEARPTAEEYAAMNSPFAAAGLKGPPATVAALAKIDSGGKNPAQFLKDNYAEQVKQWGKADVDTALQSLESGGNLYKVDLPDEQIAKMLDWDKPLSEQSPEIQNALSQYSKNYENPEKALRDFLGTDYAKEFPDVRDVKWAKEILNNPDYDIAIDGKAWLDSQMRAGVGSSFYNLLGSKNAGQIYERMAQDLGGANLASQKLYEAGIPGIQYLDQASRGAGEGTRNYVVFSDEIPQILERNNQPVAQALREYKQLESLNPTGTVMTGYNPSERATLPLGKNLTTLDVTAGVSPDEMVEIYRGVPQGISEISPGDFITTNRQLAQDYAGSGNVISQKVPYRTILDDLTEPLGEEYIYRP